MMSFIGGVWGVKASTSFIVHGLVKGFVVFLSCRYKCNCIEKNSQNALNLHQLYVVLYQLEVAFAI